jgi:hypothetical protein
LHAFLAQLERIANLLEPVGTPLLLVKDTGVRAQTHLTSIHANSLQIALEAEILHVQIIVTVQCVLYVVQDMKHLEILVDLVEHKARP